MTEETKPKETKPEVKLVPEVEEARPVMVQDILKNYPADRDGARDAMLLTISNNLNRIATTLEYFANQDITDRKAKEIQKQ